MFRRGRSRVQSRDGGGGLIRAAGCEFPHAMRVRAEKFSLCRQGALVTVLFLPCEFFTSTVSPASAAT